MNERRDQIVSEMVRREEKRRMNRLESQNRRLKILLYITESILAVAGLLAGYSLMISH